MLRTRSAAPVPVVDLTTLSARRSAPLREGLTRGTRPLRVRDIQSVFGGRIP